MSETAGVEIRFSTMLKWLMGLSVSAGLFGATGSYMAAGWDGIYAEIASWVAVTIVMVCNGLIIVRLGRYGPSRVVMGFAASSILRLVMSPLLVWCAWKLLDLPLSPLFAWLVVFYLASLAAECIWVVRALRRHVRRMAAGEVSAMEPGGPVTVKGADGAGGR